MQLYVHNIIAPCLWLRFRSLRFCLFVRLFGFPPEPRGFEGSVDTESVHYLKRSGATREGEINKRAEPSPRRARVPILTRSGPGQGHRKHRNVFERESIVCYTSYVISRGPVLTQNKELLLISRGEGVAKCVRRPVTQKWLEV